MADKAVPPPGDAAPDWGGAQDPTLVSGQDPKMLFGIPVSYDTGAGKGRVLHGGFMNGKRG